MKQSDTIYFAVIGLAHGHIYQMCDGLISAGAKIKYVYDEDEKAVNEFIQSYPQAKPVHCEKDILSDPEIFLIATADIPSRRADLAIRAMKAGKDFFTAKAPFISLKQLHAVKRAIEKTGRKYFVFYSEYLQSEAALYARSVIEQGGIGKVLNVVILAPHKLGENRPEWFFSKKDTGGILIDIGSHQFEQFLTFSGNKKVKILSANAANFGHSEKDEFEDFGDVHLIGENGTTCYIRVDWFTPDALPVFGDGKVVIVGDKGYMELRKYIDVGCGDQTENIILVANGKAEKFSAKGKIHKTFFQALLSDCRNRTETAMPVSHAFYAMELAIKAQQCAQRTRKRYEHRF